MNAPGAADPLTGRHIGNYLVADRLGAGGMGVVYRATDVRLGRTVALKFLPPDLAENTGRERLLQEARAACSLDHPNIGIVHGIEEASDGTMFIVMAYYEGATVHSLLQRGRLESPQTIDIAIQTAQALAEAHGKGIVHRDIKPSNIMVTRQGVVKLLDFGVAKFSGAGTLTRTGTAVGTAAYMSPEQALGRPLDHRTDIWSLGTVMFEMLDGTLPFSGDSTPAMLFAIAHDPPRVLEGVRPELEAAVYRCLAKDPDGRYEHAGELVRDLSALRSSAPGGTVTLAIDTGEIRRKAWNAAATPSSGLRRPSGIEPGTRPRRRRALIAGAVLLLLCAAVFGLWQWRAASSMPREKHVVVLPFTNVGGDPANAAICDGLLETLTSRLTTLEKTPGTLWVAPATEVRRRHIADAVSAERAFGANLVVSGSVQRDERGVRLTVNLVDARTLRQLGSAVFDDPQGNFAALQDDAVARLARLLETGLAPAAPAAGETSNTGQAYESYLKGLGLLQRYDKPANLDSAIRLFEDAVARDPRFALAYARLADAQWLKYRVESQNQAWIQKALANGTRAAEINGQLAPVHITLGRIHAGTGNYDLAVQEYQRALELDPRAPDAFQQLGRAYESMGRLKEAEQAYKKAIALRPDYWDGFNSLGAFYYRQSRFAEAAVQFRRVLDLTPDNAQAYSNLGVVLNHLGDAAGARRAYEKSIALSPTYSAFTNLAGIYYNQGDYPQAAATYERALALSDRDFHPWAGLASAYEAAGDSNNARRGWTRAAAIAEAQEQKDPNNADTQSFLASCYAHLGNRSDAIRHAESSLVLAPGNSAVLYRAGLVYETLGDRAAALKWIAAALASGYPRERVRHDPDARKLTSDPAFQSLLR